MERYFPLCRNFIYSRRYFVIDPGARDDFVVSAGPQIGYSPTAAISLSNLSSRCPQEFYIYSYGWGLPHRAQRLKSMRFGCSEDSAAWRAHLWFFCREPRLVARSKCFDLETQYRWIWRPFLPLRWCYWCYCWRPGLSTASAQSWPADFVSWPAYPQYWFPASRLRRASGSRVPLLRCCSGGSDPMEWQYSSLFVPIHSKSYYLSAHFLAKIDVHQRLFHTYSDVFRHRGPLTASAQSRHCCQVGHFWVAQKWSFP